MAGIPRAPSREQRQKVGGDPDTDIERIHAVGETRFVDLLLRNPDVPRRQIAQRKAVASACQFDGVPAGPAGEIKNATCGLQVALQQCKGTLERQLPARRVGPAPLVKPIVVVQYPVDISHCLTLRVMKTHFLASTFTISA